MAKYRPDQGLLAELLELVKGSDSVELKLTVADTDVRSVVQSLGMDPLDAEIRRAVFFDTPDLQLNRAGVVVRARRIQGGHGDTVVKLRPVVPDQLSKEDRRSSSFNVEVDVMPGGFVCSASMKGKATAEEVREVILREAPVKGVFSKEQRSFYKEHAPRGLKLNDLSILGPVTLLKLKYTPEGFTRRVVAELWLFPDGSRILELSTKCRSAEAFQAGTEWRAFLDKRGVVLTDEQQTKTRTALAHFSSLLADLPK